MVKKEGCCYCEKNDYLRSFSTKICDLGVSNLYLFKDQTHYGRCCIAYEQHCDELFELSEEKRNAFMNDVARVAKAVKKVTGCDKINYAAFGDKVSHLHFHIVPKKEGSPDWGGMFQMNTGAGHLNKEDEQALIEKIRENL